MKQHSYSLKKYHNKFDLCDPYNWRIGKPRDLEDDIEMFCSWIKPTQEEIVIREKLQEKIFKIIRSCCGENSRPIVFGSMASKLYLPTSDIDIVVFDAEGGSDYWLYKLAEAISQNLPVENMKLLPEAKVPVIKFCDSESKVNIDICFNVQNALDSTATIQKFIKKYTKLIPLALVVKYLLFMNRYNAVYSGGLGSYSLVLMIVAFFQQKYQSPCDCNAQPTAILLRSFFQFYGFEFDYNSKVITVTNGGQFLDKQAKGWCNPSLPVSLSIEDPNYPDNDVSRSSYKISEVQFLFMECFAVLSNPELKLENIFFTTKYLLTRRNIINEVYKKNYSYNDKQNENNTNSHNRKKYVQNSTKSNYNCKNKSSYSQRNWNSSKKNEPLTTENSNPLIL